MLVDLTPNIQESKRRTKIAKEANFEYVPQFDAKWKVDKGIYRCSFDYNFAAEEFHEKIERPDLNAHICDPDTGFFVDDFDGIFISSYGVADNIDQIINLYAPQIMDPDKRYIITLTPVFQDKSNRGKGGGWRWHKWGEYIGTLQPQCEYLDDEDFTEDFKYVLCYSLMKVIE